MVIGRAEASFPGRIRAAKFPSDVASWRYSNSQGQGKGEEVVGDAVQHVLTQTVTSFQGWTPEESRWYGKRVGGQHA